MIPHTSHSHTQAPLLFNSIMSRLQTDSASLSACKKTRDITCLPRRLLIRHSRAQTVSQCPFCHCERPKGARQSLNYQYIVRLLRSFHSLAMTLHHGSSGRKGGSGFSTRRQQLILFLLRQNARAMVILEVLQATEQIRAAAEG